jgi:hypothetical protein
MDKLKIIGIDPSLRNCGIVKATLDPFTLEYTVDDLILVSTESQDKKVVRKNSDDLRRGKLLFDGLTEACRGASIAIAEIPVGSQSARAMASYGVCVGVLAGCPIPLIQVIPTEVKMAAVGSKTASKAEMIAWATEKFPAAPWLTRKFKGKLDLIDANEHLADAIGAIEAGLLTAEFERMVTMYKAIAA